MSESNQRPTRVGVRELRQNLSVYLDLVKEGETLDVTEHGRLVASLGPPVPHGTSRLDQLIAGGRATSASGDLLDLGPPLPLPDGAPLPSEVLRQMRDDER
jgi:antitoxin (DNA-binding transcriptional repressor) of toxin-antitoxin stability system